MHSRVFVMYDKERVENGEYESVRMEEDYREDLCVADYVVKQEEDEFKEDIEWLCSSYGIEVPIKEVETEEGKILVGEITPENQKKILKCLKEKKERNIKEAREMLSKPIDEISLSLVADTLNSKRSFWFDVDTVLMPEMDLYECCPFQGIECCSLPSIGNKEPKTYYIVETYDYHF